ncbi:MAG TPA: Gfo/Idh/MocA family oxidoreductase [Reyranella sp.]|nr:Gfo/Idh/MocA family oxidoreductase [Reyranella sp.]
MIRAAIIGMGWWGKTLVDSVQDKSDAITFTAGATRTREKAADYAAKAGIDLKDDYEAVLADPAIDAVVLATPHLDHARQIEAAAQAGKHVFVEKPFTMTKASAQAAVQAVKSAGVTLGLGHNRRFHPNMARLRDMIHRGELGAILHCDGVMTAPSGLFLPKGVWRTDPEQSPAGGMTGLGIHIVDGMIELFGEIERVACQSVHRAAPSGLPDTTSVLLRFASGQTGSLLAMTTTAPTYRFGVYGSKGTAEITSPSLARFVFYPAPDAPNSSNPAPKPPVTHEVQGADTVRAELEAFAQAVEGGAPFPITHDQMIHGVAVLEAIVAALGQDRFVSVNRG